MNPYEILGVEVGSSEERLREAFLELARRYHPDTATSEEDRVKKENLFKEITRAYDILKRKNVKANNNKDNRFEESKKESSVDDEGIIKKKAHIYIHNGDYNSAINILNTLDVMDYEANMLMGIALFKKGRYHTSLNFFKKAIEINPWKAESYAYLGEVYFSIGLKKSAGHYYREALSIDASNAIALKGLEKLDQGKFSLKSFFKKG